MAAGKEAALKLEFLVVGGGLGGLAVAYALCKGGHSVRVFEKQPALGIPAGGLRVPPNMSKILTSWAGAEEVQKTAVLCVGTPWHNLESGEYMGYAEWKPQVMAETGGDFFVMKHEDVHRLLYDLAISAGAKVTFGASVKSVQPGEPKPSITLSTGQVLTADMVIGADGPNSKVRQVVNGGEDTAEPSGFTIFGGIVPASEMLKDPALAKWVSSDEWPIFMGNNRSICAHPVHGKEEFAFQAYWPDEDSGPETIGEDAWTDVVPVSTLNYEHISTNIKRVVSLAPHLVKTRWMKRDERVEHWSDESGRIILLGEAAHPWFPGGTHGPAIALEDAAVFGTLFSRLRRVDQIGAFVSAYQEIREDRTRVVNDVDVSNAELVRLPPGPHRDARDKSIRQSRREWDDGALQREFEGVAALFSYEAVDAADEWWLNWGRFNEADEDRERSGFSFASVTVGCDQNTL
ncbi:FAD/NAD(P)-binding domain-containing protein [Cytidiella melzeri]|nr:FAD/NAD(P)-binding domain-containing protein [Cytidiella melzeri]